MFNKYVRTPIIVVTKYILPVLLLLLLAPQLLTFSPQLTEANHFFHTYKALFLAIHSFFYLALYWLWPHLINHLITRSVHEPSPERIQLALKAKWYLIAALIFFETLVWLR
jgi:amino acid permease